MNVSAKLVAAGVGLPPWWLEASCLQIIRTRDMCDPPPDLSRFSLDTTDHQTAFGLALKLDEYEQRTDDTRWVLRLAYAIVGSPQWVEAVAEMVARIHAAVCP